MDRRLEAMSIHTNEGELEIQSPEISSTVPAFISTSLLNSSNYNFHERILHPNHAPILWLPNQEPSFPRSNLNINPPLRNNGRVIIYF